MTSEQLNALEKDFDLTLGLHAFALEAPERCVAFQDDEPFPAASTIKVFILAKLLEQVAAGALLLDDEQVVETTDMVSGSGVLKALQPDRRYTLNDLATLMIVVSDNTATNVLIEVLGVETINAYCQAHGWHETFLAGKLQVETAPPTAASHTSAKNLARAMYGLWSGKLVPQTETDLARRIFSAQQYTDQLGRELGYDAYSAEIGESDLRIASKSGSIRGVRNDVGVITRGNQGFVLAVMTKDAADPRFYPENPGSRAIMKAARLAHQHFLGKL